MRIGVLAGRAKIVTGGRAFDIADISGRRFGPEPMAVYEAWDDFVAWAATADITSAGPAEPFTIDKADAPVPAPRQIFGVGLNYRAHQLESGLPEPDVPLVFTKFPSSVTGPAGTIDLPGDQVDWEVELAVVIGRRAYEVPADQAWSHVAGLTAAQDLSARDVQMRPAGTPQFSLGKSFPGFTPLGPVLVTPDEWVDRDAVPLSCAINGEETQSSTSADLIFDVPSLIAYLSGILPLLPGDVILTGTPSGVGIGQNPPRFLTDGDEILTRVGDLTMRHRVAGRR
ncbi:MULTISPECIES: fumarylacetoacetate hydrolase family protein [unclassified Streptomyces]|uniref:fumarylacetoacetate hydrolase family protein n=1 Tax=unclassified Streptomyces TaxID=2593676 RepID=UPI0035D8E542